MVMEALPPAEVVGREFVRQYYTLLNEAPAHAHRFYANNSYFVHGSMSTPAIGQQQIHQKIVQLNFRDCHTKISQVDSQETLGNGVVVQVSGELSNDGEPMRRFTQTFVLGVESPRKYYVHNDIFRYQDMLLSDEGGDSPSGDEDIEQIQDDQPEAQTGGNINYFKLGNVGPVETPTGPNSGTNQTAPLNGTAVHEDSHQGQSAIVPPQEPTSSPVVNGSAVAEELKIMNEDFMMASQGTVQPEIKSPKEKVNRAVSSKPVEMEESAQAEQETSTNGNESFSAEMIQDLHISAVSNEPKTYANLLKSDRMGSGLPSGATGNVINRNTPGFSAPSSGASARPDDAPQPPRPPRGMPRGVPLRGNNRGDRTLGPSRTSFNEDGSTVGGNTGPENQERRRNLVQYSDNHQLFMGNLPLDATESDLRELFSKYGTIVDLHIHSKTSSGPKGPPVNRVPNYGFITFEDPQSVQEVLNNKPICFPSEGGVKLNVEEKRVRPKSSTLSSQGGGGGGGNSGGNESNWTAGRQSLRGGPPRGSRGGGARGSFNRDSRGPPVNQRSNFTQRR
ncbi:UNVERIFIED_CONTAM: hypothetical protein PYX00_002369 [Menopon gallinae]|uniref:Ras GTPase-activating protein-binding protein 2 n=1 Tax=Menopon gallinae TaxID=328185 RepID=A0AAW2IHT2_9NEOP